MMNRLKAGASGSKTVTPSWRTRFHPTMASDLAHRARSVFVALTTADERRKAARVYRWIAGRQRGVALWLISGGAIGLLAGRLI